MKNINIKELENVLYEIYPSTNGDIFNIKYTDYDLDEKEEEKFEIYEVFDSSVKFPNVIDPKHYSKSGNMNSLVIKKDLLNMGNGEFDTQKIKTLLMESIGRDFIEKVEYMGELNRHSKYTPSFEKFDLNVIEADKRELIKRYDKDQVLIEECSKIHTMARVLLPHIIRCGSWIATNGRIGPGTYLIMNTGTYEYLKPFFLEIGLVEKEKFNEYYEKYKYAEPDPETPNLIAKLSSFNIIIDDRLQDDRIIEGRKNKVYHLGCQEIGVSTIIWSDEDGNIMFVDGEDDIELKYSVVDAGFHPETQYYTIHLIRN
jgi:hypothetical protein